MPNMLDLDTRFSQQPQANIPRSVMKRNSDRKTTMNYGLLTPIYLDEILPADSKKIDLASLVRMSTPLFPVMDSSYMDIFAFFVPNRLTWNHWEEFMGENKDSAWVSDVEYSIPVLDVTNRTNLPNGMFASDSIFDHFNLPTMVRVPNGSNISALPLRAYNLIWNEWFRDQNYQNPIPLNTGDDDSTNVYKLLRVNKLHDEFTSVLPEPQKGESVSLLFNGGVAPVVTTSDNEVKRLILESILKEQGYVASIADAASVQMAISDATNEGMKYYTSFIGNDNAATGYLGLGGSFEVVEDGAYDRRAVYKSDTDLQGNTTVGNGGVVPSNLYADMSQATISTINQLRNAVVVQQYLERLANGGSRYTEIIRSLFGVVSPDARLQRPELLGHIRMNIEMNQVIQTSFEGGSADATTPLGNTGAYSKTTHFGHLFEKSFVEHGYLLILACARTELSYQQGIERMWTRRSVTDFYNPLFANIGNQPIENQRIYFSSNADQNKEVFGYQEAWSEYRYKPSSVTGAFRSNHPQSLDAWHYSEYFTELPVASAEFFEQGEEVVDRTLAVNEGAQLLCNFYFNEIATRPMPVYSIPGLDVL